MTEIAPHQYIHRKTAEVRTETLFADRLVNTVFSEARERPGALFKALASARFSRLLGFLSYDHPLAARLSGAGRFGEALGVDLEECLDPPETLDTARKLFERKIRYWETRPMPADPSAVVSPADAKMVIGSLARTSGLFLKEKFFAFEELLGGRAQWIAAFADGEAAIFRLTPDKYHYNHAPVAGAVVDHFVVEGDYWPCNPGAVVALATPFSKNRRAVTVIDTDAPGGTGAGLVAMIEVVALMIGDIVQCYSAERYDAPVPIRPGMFLERGRPKSLYRPGSSTDVLLFQKNRIAFDADLLANQRRRDVRTRFAEGFGVPLVETEVTLRSGIGRALPREEEP
jgi:phosphatidylserine decarboxylase